MPQVVCRKSAGLDDWYVIELAEHSGAQGLVPTGPGVLSFYSAARISDADVEGTGGEMLAVADAIEQRRSVNFRRCAATLAGESYELESPRNSTRPGKISLDEADALARSIRDVVVATAVEPRP
jgi:hypothetical protein